MPKVTIQREGITFEAEVTFAELKELVGLNGNGHSQSTPTPTPRAALAPVPEMPRRSRDFEAFFAALSDRAKLFLRTLAERPQGIDAAELAPILSFSTANQIGGLTGPGITKVAELYDIEAIEIYSSTVEWPNGERKRMFYPGPLLREKMRKPA